MHGDGMNTAILA